MIFEEGARGASRYSSSEVSGSDSEEIAMSEAEEDEMDVGEDEEMSKEALSLDLLTEAKEHIVNEEAVGRVL